MDWDNPEDRARLVERVGPIEYERLHMAHVKASTLETVNGYGIRPVRSPRFGLIYMVDGAGAGFSTIEKARKHAASLMPRRTKS